MRTGARTFTLDKPNLKGLFQNMPFTSSAHRTPEPDQTIIGKPGNPVSLTEADKIRAMAHPARIALMQHLAIEGPRTATECAPVAGLSPSACSYHLRLLARYGFVEQDTAAATNGRERPWRAKVISTRLEQQDDPVAAMASELLRRSLDEHWQEVHRRFRLSEADYPADWRAAAGTDQTIVYVTAPELKALREQIQALYLRFVKLSGDDRPEDARPVQFVLDLAPMFQAALPAEL